MIDSARRAPDVPTWQAELFVPDAGVLTERPPWDDRTGRLSWVDIYASTLNSCGAKGHDRRSEGTGPPLGSFAPRAEGGFVLALETGLALSLDPWCVLQNREVTS